MKRSKEGKELRTGRYYSKILNTYQPHKQSTRPKKNSFHEPDLSQSSILPRANVAFTYVCIMRGNLAVLATFFKLLRAAVDAGLWQWCARCQCTPRAQTALVKRWLFVGD